MTAAQEIRNGLWRHMLFASLTGVLIGALLVLLLFVR